MVCVGADQIEIPQTPHDLPHRNDRSARGRDTSVTGTSTGTALGIPTVSPPHQSHPGTQLYKTARTIGTFRSVGIGNSEDGITRQYRYSNAER